MLSNIRSTSQMPLPQPFHEIRVGGLESGIEPVWTIPQMPHPASTAERWASYVLGACKSAKDPKTLGIWARQIAVSYTTLCESCRLIGVSPRYARDFARVLRLILMPPEDTCDITCLLDISDRRTLNSILERAGFGHHAMFSGQVSVVSFLDNQRFIPRENAGFRIIRSVFASL